MNKKLFLLIITGVLCASFARANDFAVSVLDYKPGKDAGVYNNPSLALGAPVGSSSGSIPNNNSIVSLGGFGGYIILGFDHRVENDPLNPGGWDFIIFGNSFYVNGDENIYAQEPGFVEVAADNNGNSLADDTFYLIFGIPSAGFSSDVPISSDYWALNGVDHRDYFTRGYADVTPVLSESFGSALAPDDPYANGITSGSRGGDAFDISDAVDINGGLLHLSHIDFVKITTAVDCSWPWGTAVSAEIDAVADVAPIPEPPTIIMIGAALALFFRRKRARI